MVSKYKIKSIFYFFIIILFSFFAFTLKGSAVYLDKISNEILQIPENCTAKTLIKKVEELGYLGSVYDQNDVIINNNAIVTPNHCFKSGIKKYSIIVSGDVSSDGIINSTDYLLIKNYILNKTTFSDIQFKCGDINEDGLISCIDYIKIKAHFLKIKYIVEPFENEIDTNYYNINYTVSDSSMGYISGDKTQTLKAGETGSTIIAYPNMYYKFVCWSDGLETPQRSDIVYEDKTYEAVFKYVGLPVVSVNYDSTIMRDSYTTGDVSISNCLNDLVFNNKSMQIKGRGNSSWNFEKKSYKIKFDKKVNLFGIGKSARKDWVLISNHCDKTLLRNYFTYNLAKDFDGIDVTLGTIQVHLYMNGEYRGVYMITEEIEVNEGRVEIDDSGDEENIGFLLELDNYYSGVENIDYVKVNDLYFSIKSDFTNQNQISYMKNILLKADNALRSGNQSAIEQTCDIDSLVDMYILQELVKNIDVGWSSFYMYYDKTDPRIHFGPVWDADLGMGNDYRLDNGSSAGIYVGKDYNWAQTNKWFVSLAKRSWFKKMVTERWTKLEEKILYNIDELEKFVNIHSKELERNFSKWKIFNIRINTEPDYLLRFNSYKQNTNHLILWLKERTTWLSNYFKRW